MSTILVVEDQPDARDVLLRLFDRAGHTALGAADGAQALDLLRSVCVDLVLLDYMMPGADGLTVLRRLRGDQADCPARNAHIVLYTAVTDSPVHDAARAAGADEILVKPIPFTDLLARVTALLATQPPAANPVR